MSREIPRLVEHYDVSSVWDVFQDQLRTLKINVRFNFDSI